jgi:hypothetical protein
MSKRKEKKKPLTTKLQITHSFPPPRADDADRFLSLVRMLIKMGDAARVGPEQDSEQ